VYFWIESYQQQHFHSKVAFCVTIKFQLIFVVSWQMMEESTKLWGCGGRFLSMNVDLQQLNNSLRVDKRLYAEDIAGSLAYAEALKNIKILDERELKLIREGFKVVKNEWQNGTIVLSDDDEDVHSVNERRLTELIGDVGRKIHTGRSRNDQVALDMKLWTRKSVQSIICQLKSLLKVMTCKADEKIHVIMPGYTHLQVIINLFVINCD
jgi:argininosuccinate lyase